MSFSVGAPRTPVQHSALFGGAAWSFTGDVAVADAKTAAHDVLNQWPRWQISYAFGGAGSTKTATLLPYWQDEEDEWHSLGALSLKDEFSAGDIESQLSDVIAPAGAKAIAMALSDFTDGGPITVKVRGVSS